MANPLNIGQPALALPHSIVTDGVFPSSGTGSDTFSSSAEIGFIIQTVFHTDRVDALTEANGQLLSYSSGNNNALWSVIGNMYGGNPYGFGDAATFALPDLQGAAPLFLTETGSYAEYGVTQGTPGNTVSLTQQQLPAALGGESAPISNEQYGLGMQYLIKTAGSFPEGPQPEPDTIGMVYPFAGRLGGGEVAGFLPADGRLLKIADYEPLYAVLGNTYGGDWVTTFALPDLRNHVPIGAGATAAGETTVVGQTLGSAELVLTSSDLPGAGGAALQTIQPSLAMNYVINTEGFYEGFGDMGSMLGQVTLYAGQHIPEQWTLAHGQVLPVSNNTALYAVMGGAVFGGNGWTTFALPDLRGRTAIGTGGELNLRVGDVIGSTEQTLSLQNLPELVVPVPNAQLVSDSGEPLSGDVIDAFNLEITGLWPQATVEYSTDGQTWGSSYTPVDGSNTVMIRQVAVTGQTSLPGDAITFELDAGSGPPPELDVAESTPEAPEDPVTDVTPPDAALQVSVPAGVEATSQEITGTSADTLRDLLIAASDTKINEEQVFEEILQSGIDSYVRTVQDQEAVTVHALTFESDGTVPGQPILVTGTDASDTQTLNSQEALIIDARNLPPGTVLQLDKVEFAIILGEVKVEGGEGRNFVIGDDSAQYIVLGEDDDVLRGGGGDDTIGSRGGDDQLFGDNGNDALFGGTGHNLLHGGEGSDVATYEGNIEDFLITRDHGKTLVSSLLDPGMQDTLINAELIRFSNQDYQIENSNEFSLIATLYHQVLGRQAEIDGFQYWAAISADGQSLGRIAMGFLRSVEKASAESRDFDALSAEDQIESLYNDLLGRASEEAGKVYWLEQLNSGTAIEDIASGFVYSPEFAGMQLNTTEWNFFV